MAASLTPKQLLAGDDGASSASSSGHDSLPPPEISAGETTQGSSTTKRDDDKRQVGDLSIYLYYFSALGWPRFALFGIFVASNLGFGTLQCKHASSIRSAPFISAGVVPLSRSKSGSKLMWVSIDAWVTRWAQSSDGSQASRLGYWLGLYALFGVFTAAGLISAV